MARVAVLGPGGVGGFLAAALSHAGVATTVVAREETGAAIASNGLRLSSVRLGEIVATPSVTAGAATISPSRTLERRSPPVAIAATVCSRATTVVATPAWLSAAARNPPTPPGPSTATRAIRRGAYVAAA
jgi:2-dehydropantoate 2-reductase